MTSTHAPVEAPVATTGRTAPRTERAQGRSAGDTAVTAGSHAVLIIWSLLVIIPLLWVVMSSFKTSSEIFASPFALPERLRFDNYVNAWTDAGIGRFFFPAFLAR